MCNEDNFRHYLKDAKILVRDKFESTKCWIYPYDGQNPPQNALDEEEAQQQQQRRQQQQQQCNVMQQQTDSGHVSSSPTINQPAKYEDEADDEFWRILMKDSSVSEEKLNSAINEMKLNEAKLKKNSILFDSEEDSEEDFSPRNQYLLQQQQQQQQYYDDVDFTVTSLGECFRCPV